MSIMDNLLGESGWWVYGMADAKLRVYGPWNSSIEADQQGQRRFAEDYEVVQLGTRRESDAVKKINRLVNDRLFRARRSDFGVPEE